MLLALLYAGETAVFLMIIFALSLEVFHVSIAIQTYDLHELARFIGVVGFLLYMAAFAGLQLGWLCGNGILYSALNVGAAAMVLISLSTEFNLASALIQVSWISIGMIGISLRIWARSRAMKTLQLRVEHDQ
ncbi:CBU_0592 family membrane protein [Primorskyibacter sp. S187A]|uniref:CBU_0592 family membrane protein n=1 Tax=Primorskyibacter sp. S187A TaxID=3415130 RepID=UPI003C7BC139